MTSHAIYPRLLAALLVVCVVFIGLQLVSADPPAADAPAESRHFDDHVAPLLARRCLECHNASDKKGGLDLTRGESALAGGDSGPAIMPGRPDESLLWARIEAGEMPPKMPLDDEERSLLRKWVVGGAAWGTSPIDPFRFSSDRRAGYDWWALAPVEAAEPPPVRDGAWPAGAIDQFVLAKLEANQLTPAPPAERGVLIRRLSFDLIGLPPTPEETAAFVADESPEAYARLVDRLLDSPHYGERWARHWLDVDRFGESQGFERDKLRPNAWPYRDWVIMALNDDMPYDEFARLQLAGDVLRPDDPLAVAATGFLTAGAYDEVGQTQQSAAMRAVVREDELEDIVGVTCQTFLGLTANCARCHDHKFDPIRQREYYQLAAALAGVRHGERERLSDAGRASAQAQARALETRIAELAAELAAITAPIRERLSGKPRKVDPPKPIARWEFDSDLSDSLGSMHGTAHGSARLEGGRLLLDGKESYVSTAPLAANLAAKTLEVWVALGSLDQHGGGAISVETLDGGTFDAVVFGEREPARWMAGSNGFTRTQSFQGEPETARSPDLVQVTIVYGEDQSITCYRNGLPYGQPYQAAAVQGFEAAKSHVVFGLRHAPVGGDKMLAGEIDRAQLYDRALAPEEVAASAGIAIGRASEDEVIEALSETSRSRYNALTRELSLLRCRERLLSGGLTYAVSPQAPQARHVLDRGNPARPLEQVTPGGVGALSGPSADWGCAADASEAERRTRLAGWIADRSNPLLARVIVNRLWQHHFGQGLVETPNDFGFNGGRPSHPELLDFLAAELARQGWRLKAMHRLIVMSAAYRQSSRFDAASAAIDADNRLLWRKSPLRLEAEAIRDAVLAVSGELNPTMGGPGYADFRTFNFNSQFYEPIDPVGRAFNRRSIYRAWVRSGTSPLLDVLDCPDPSTTSPKRVVTTTPLAALALLNDSFMLRMAERFAARLQRERPDEESRIARAYQLAYARDALPEEISLARPFVAEHGLWAFCRVLFNSSEFVHVD